MGRAVLADASVRLQTNDEAIANGLSGLPADEIGAILSAHSPYDHLADLPHILMRHTPEARLYLNDSGSKIMAPFEDLWGRLTAIDGHAGEWIRMRDSSGCELPARVMPLLSSHAGHFWKFHYGSGHVSRSWESWSGRKLRHMKEGRTFTLLIDLLSEDGGRTWLTRDEIVIRDDVPNGDLGYPTTVEYGDRKLFCIYYGQDGDGITHVMGTYLSLP